MTIENGHLCGDFLINMVIFHSYVSLPEGTWMYIYILYIICDCLSCLCAEFTYGIHILSQMGGTVVMHGWGVEAKGAIDKKISE